MTDATPIVILLVEDELAHAEIVRRSLADLRISNRIVHVEDGQAALDYLMSGDACSESGAPQRPDLIVLDLRLPKVDGLEVLRRIKDDASLRHIPTVVLTTSATESDIVQAYEGGAGSFLVKPADFQRFTELMESFGSYWLGWNQFPS
jgi:CheY-like chemotaxis protein